MMRGLLGTGVLAILLCAGWPLWRGHRDPPAVDDGHIRIVPAGGEAAAAHPSPLSKPASIPPGGGPETALPDLEPLSVNERAAMLDGRSREPVWARHTESELTRQLAGAMRGLAVQSARCADRLCAVEGRLQSFGDHQSAVAQLVDGRLAPAYARAGLVPAGSIEIEADDRGDLHFTQYLQRPR